MQVCFKPDSVGLLEALASGSFPQDLEDPDSLVDVWFRTVCTVDIHVNGAVVTLEDDLGFFFAKWMQISKRPQGQQVVYFVGGVARFPQEDVLLSSAAGGTPVELPNELLRLCIHEIADELEAQLRVIEIAEPSCESETARLRVDYLEPLKEFVGSPTC